MGKKYRMFSIPIIAMLVALLLVGLAVALPVQAGDQPTTTCVRHKHVENWTNTSALAAHGFFGETFSPQASLSFGQGDGYKFLSLDLATTPDFAGEYVASRITEIDTSPPADQRVKCWQPGAGEQVVVETVIRFDQAQPPFGLTENVFLWNAPFGQNPLPITAIGATRSLDLATFQPQYSAIVAQDLVLFPFSGLLVTQPMPTWLDASDWHWVRITVTETQAIVEVAQGEHAYTSILQVSLLHAPEALGFEYSVDNEVFPSSYAPVTVPDGLDTGYLDIRLTD